MARSTAKVILFSRVTVDKKVHQWPVAVFNNHPDARTYATLVKMAHAAGNVELAKSLDPKTVVTDDGKLADGLKFSIVEVPYAPQPDFSKDDTIESDETPTS